MAQSFSVNPRANECNSDVKVVPLSERCIYGDESNVTVAIWGDSHANALALGLGQELQAAGRGLVEHTYSACPPAINLIRPSRTDACAEFNDEVARALAEDSSIETVVLLSRWSLYIEGTPFDNGEGGVESLREVHAAPRDNADMALDSEQRREQVAQLYLDQILFLLDQGKQVVLVHPVPEAGWDVPAYLAREIQFGIEREDVFSTSYARYRERHRVLLNAFSRLPASPNLIHVLPQRIFCDSIVAERCVLEDGGGPLYSDDDHLNIRSNEVIAQYIVSELGYE